METVYICYAVCVLSLDKVVDIVVRNEGELLRLHQELNKELSDMLGSPDYCGHHARISPEMQKRFEYFVISINEAAFQDCTNEEEPFEISVYPL